MVRFWGGVSSSFADGCLLAVSSHGGGRGRERETEGRERRRGREREELAMRTQQT